MSTPSEDLRKGLEKVLPGYKWTVHRSSAKAIIVNATGIQSSGFNRTSTVTVAWRFPTGSMPDWFQVSGFGYGTRGNHIADGEGPTLVSAIRNLQDTYVERAERYSVALKTLQEARAKPTPGPIPGLTD